MIDAHTAAVFGLAALALLAVPGPAVLYIVARSVADGRRAGIVSVAGVHVGTLVHVVAAVGGLSAILASSALAFTIVKYAGAGYLVFLGVRTLLTRSGEVAGARSIPTLRRVFWQGVVVNVTNPKTALFFLAFLPQFVDRDAAAPALQALLLGLLFVALGVLSDGAYALGAASVAARLRTAVAQRVQRITSGLVLIALGAAAALTGSHTSPSGS